MARSITTAYNNAIKAQTVIPFFATELAFNTGTLRFWNGYGDITMTAGGSSNTFRDFSIFIAVPSKVMYLLKKCLRSRSYF